MKILIDDGMQVNVGTGIGKYTLYLYNTLKKVYGESNQIDIVKDELSGTKKLKRLKYLLNINSSAYKKNCKNYDVVHYTNYVMPFRRNKHTKYVVTIHDLVSFIYPKSLPFLYRFYSRFVIRYTIKHADAILTDSQSVKNEINEYFPKAKEKTYAIYPGLYSEITPLSDDETQIVDGKFSVLKEKPFFLFVGTIEKRKNIDKILDAFFKLKETEPLAKDYCLVLAGRPGYGYENFESKIASSKYKNDVILTGYIDKELCNKLYNKAKAYIFPTVYEGFGSTQLECMACHTPIILSDIKTNREVSGEYGLFFDLDNIDSLVEKMSLIVSEKYDYNKYNKIADELLLKFDWNTLVVEFVNLYKALVKNT